MAKKSATPTPCPVTRAEFNADGTKGSEIMTKLNEEIGLVKKHFSSGGFGFNGTGKITMKIGNEIVRCQVGINVIVINSKNAEDGEAIKEAA